MQQGDLQLQLGSNRYTRTGRASLDRAIAQHGGGMSVYHTHDEDKPAEAERDEEMRRALSLEQRISALASTRSLNHDAC